MHLFDFAAAVRATIGVVPLQVSLSFESLAAQTPGGRRRLARRQVDARGLFAHGVHRHYQGETRSLGVGTETDDDTDMCISSLK